MTRSPVPSGRTALFLDRDGVLNRPVWRPQERVHESPLLPDEVELVPAAGVAVRRAREAGLLVVVASNQPAAAKGTVPLTTLRQVHERVLDRLAADSAAVDASYVCWHHPDAIVPALGGVCDCRKPRPGLLHQAERGLGLDLASSWLVGDTDADVGAARAAGLAGVAVVLEPRSAHRRGRISKSADLTARDTAGAVTQVLARIAAAAHRG